MPEIIPGQNSSSNDRIREYLDLITVGVDPDESKWRPLTGSTRTDLSPITQDRMQQIALFLFRVNPLANRILKLSTSFIASGSINFTAADKDVQKVMEDHWNNPWNDWDHQIYQRVFELNMYGEQLYPVTVNPKGEVLLGYVSPLEIYNVMPNPFDQSRAGMIELRKRPGDAEGKKFNVIQYNPKTGYREGDAFFFTVNKVTDSLRGTSDLLPLSDYLDALDQILFSLLERSAHMNSYIWDVTMQGASDERIRQFLSDIAANPPKPGGVRAHNELVQWQAVAPNINAVENDEQVRMYRAHILGGAGLQDWMYSAEAAPGRMSANETAEPTYKSLVSRQLEVKGFLDQLFNFVIDTAIQQKILPKNVDRTFGISLPKISLRDLQRTSGALYRAAQAIEVMLNNGLIDRPKAVQLAASLIDQLDLESDIEISDLPEMPNVANVKVSATVPASLLNKDNTKPPPAPKPVAAKPAVPVNGNGVKPTSKG